VMPGATHQEFMSENCLLGGSTLTPNRPFYLTWSSNVGCFGRAWCWKRQLSAVDAGPEELLGGGSLLTTLQIGSMSFVEGESKQHISMSATSASSLILLG
jgi:hypothetical protein